MSASLPRAESLGFCKRRRVEVQSNEGCRDAVASAFFQDNVEAEVDNEAFGASGVTVLGAVDDNDREQAEQAEAEQAEQAEQADADEEEQGELGDFEIEEADPDELLALDLGAFEEEIEEEIDVDVEDETGVEGIDGIDGIDDDIQPPHTPEETPEETPEDSPELHQPMHRTCPCPERSSLRAQGSLNGAAKRNVSFAESVAEGYLLDDPTGLKELIHVENCRFQDLWYSNPGAAVQCGWCQRDWPQAYGKLYGDESRSQFAQTDFVCNECLSAAEEAFRIHQAQKESQANASAASVASAASAASESEAQKSRSAQSEVSEASAATHNGPWDNPGSGWNDWAGDQ